jgi:hypothetical protein
MRAVLVAGKLSTIKERRQDQTFYFGEEITGTKTTTPKNYPGFESQ